MTNPTTPTASTRDVGLAIRDFLEGARFTIYREWDGELEPSNFDATVDCSDPNNLYVVLDNGQRFTVAIREA